MAKGLCCAAQAAGDLGKPLIVTMHHHDPNTGAIIGAPFQRCGVCEVAPSCRNPQKTVFRFTFLKSADCHLASGKCEPTAAGIAQYSREAAVTRVSGEIPDIYQYPVGPGGVILPPTFTPVPPRGLPYVLPNP